MEIPDELKQQCMSIFKYVRDCYGTEITKSVLFKEFNIGENNKEKIFKFLESNGIKFVKTSKKPQKKGLGQKKVAVKVGFEPPDFDNPYDGGFNSYGYVPPIRKATISSTSEPKVTASKATAKSLADSVIKRTAEEIQKKKEQEKALEDLRKVSFQSGYYGKVRKQFNTKI